MKRFACGDVVPGCEASWVCSTEDEILSRVAAHATADHGLTEIPPELVSAVRAHIVSVG
jgi:predicted small metal-binding protein